MDRLANFPIDAVIAWVDGNDLKHQQKMQPYLKPEYRRADDIAGTTRYASEGEIYYCVASVLRFASFVRKIFIVTDEQIPADLEGFINKNFPENKIPVEIIDHKVIFRGYESYLPTFNATTIETMIWRIPELSENYIYLNDDVFLLGKISECYFFDNDNAIARGRWKNLIIGDILSFLKPRKYGIRPYGFKDMMRKTAHQLGCQWQYFHIQHTPHVFKKSILEHYFTENTQILEHNIKFRFRNRTQIHPTTLFYLLGLKSGDCVMKKEKAFYMKPVKRSKNYVDRKIRYFYKKQPLAVCIGSLDQATDEDRKKVFDWLAKIININF